MRITVLIVDDEKMPRDILIQHIPWHELGADDIWEAEDGEEALRLISTHHPNIVISDIKMPRMNGMQLAEKTRELLPCCKFVFLSGYPDKEYLKGAIKLKAASFVEKPIDLTEVTNVVRELIEEIHRESIRDPRLIFFRGRNGEDTPLNTRVFHPSRESLHSLEIFLKEKKRQEAELVLHGIFNELARAEGTEPEYIRNLFCQLVLLFLKAAETRNIPAVMEKGDYLLYTAARSDTLAELWESIQEIAGLYFDEVEQEQTEPVTLVDHYLQKHYTESDLTVQSIAKELNFVNTYLCMIYKKSRGKTINQQLTQLRIQRAKELLAQPGSKLYEVAAKVGYTDGKYFAKVFTKEAGMSPRQYRGNHHEP